MRHIRFAFRRRALDSWPPFCLNFFSVNRRSEEAQIWENDLGEKNRKAFRGPPTFLTRKFLQERRGRGSFLSLSSYRRFLPFCCAKVNFSLPLLSRERKRKEKRSLCKKNISSPEPISGKKWGRPCDGKKPLFRPKNKGNCVACFAHIRKKKKKRKPF